MQGHYNIYYLFLEDKKNNPMSEDKINAVRENIEKYYEELKPPWSVLDIQNINDRNKMDE